MTSALQVGALYNPSRRSWPETPQYNCRGGEHELLLLLGAPSRSEVDAVAAGEAALALLWTPPVICLAYRFGPEGGGIPWSDTPFTVHLVPEHERTLPPAEDQAIFRTVLVDAETGIVRSLRVQLLPAGFTGALHAAIREQAAAPWDRAAYDAAVDRLLATHSSEQVAASASHVATLPEKTQVARA